MPRVGLSTESVVAAAAVLADEQGLDQLTLAALAERLGVRPPSLYAHVRGLDDVRERIATQGSEQLAVALGEAAAGRAGSDALRAISDAYRAYALAHPGSYEALQRAPAESDAGTEAAERVVGVVLAVLAGYGLQGERAIHATRTIRAALHGFVALEANGGFAMPVPLDESFAELVVTLDRGLR